MMIKPLFLSLAFLAISLATWAQVRTENERGEPIIVYADGSWEYDTEEMNRRKAALLERQGVEELVLDIRRREAEAIRDERAAQQEREDYENKVKREAQRGNPPSNGAEKAMQDELLDYFKKQERFARENRKDLSRLRKKYEDLLELPADKRQDKAEKLDRERLEVESEIAARMRQLDRSEAGIPSGAGRMNADMLEKKAREENGRQQNLEKMRRQAFAETLASAERRNQELDKLRPDPRPYELVAPDCDIVLSQVDEFTGERRLGLDKRTFFTHTDAALLPYFGDQDYIVCEGYLTQVDNKDLYLVLQFSIANLQAQRQFGHLPSKSPLSLKLLDGSTVTLYNSRSSEGVSDKLKGVTVYTGQYLIDGEAKKSLSTQEISAARVIWSTGYDNYDVFYMDFFRDMLRCF